MTKGAVALAKIIARARPFLYTVKNDGRTRQWLSVIRSFGLKKQPCIPKKCKVVVK